MIEQTLSDEYYMRKALNEAETAFSKNRSLKKTIGYKDSAKVQNKAVRPKISTS